MKPSRHHIAAVATVLALGALATVALAANREPSNDTTTARQSAPEVRTEIVRETVHRRAERSGSRRSARSGSNASARSSASPSPSRSAAPAASPHHHRGRGTDDNGVDDHGGHHHEAGDDHGGRGRGRGHGGDDD